MNIMKNEIMIFILVLLLKPVVGAKVGKTKLFINCFRNPTSTCATENCKKHNSGNQPTVEYSLTPCNVPVSNTLQGRLFILHTSREHSGNILFSLLVETSITFLLKS